MTISFKLYKFDAKADLHETIQHFGCCPFVNTKLAIYKIIRFLNDRENSTSNAHHPQKSRMNTSSFIGIGDSRVIMKKTLLEAIKEER